MGFKISLGLGHWIYRLFKKQAGNCISPEGKFISGDFIRFSSYICNKTIAWFIKSFFRSIGETFVNENHLFELVTKAGKEYLVLEEFIENLQFKFVRQLAIAIRILWSKVKTGHLK